MNRVRVGHDHVCGCFPTGRHYPGIADRIARAFARVEGLCDEFDARESWAAFAFAVIDFETTGLDPDIDRIIEIGIACFDGGQMTSRTNFIVNPGMPVPEESRQVHGITEEEIAQAPPLEEVFQRVIEVLAGRLPVAYNAEFDRRFLHAEFGRIRTPLDAALPPALRTNVVWVDPLVWAREVHKYEKSKKLAEVCARLGIEMETAHRAASDAEAAGKVLLALANDMPRTYGELVRLQASYAARQDVDLSTWRKRSN